MTLATRIRNAFRYFRAIGREPVSAQIAAARKRAVNEELRRYVIEQQLVRAVSEALHDGERVTRP
jgi:hypothetical protein